MELSNPLLMDAEATFAKCLGIMEKKNADYGGAGDDPYKNFKNSLVIGVIPQRALLVRLMDKISRASTLLDNEAQVKDESKLDTIEDAINYLAILHSMVSRDVGSVERIK